MPRQPFTQLLSLLDQYPVLDVRSPGEYQHAHIPGAYSLPLFTDEERAVVGTLYKQQGKQKAIKAGLDFFGVKMKSLVEQAESIHASFLKEQTGSEKELEATVIVHCWRGGMRSGAVAWLLELYGFRVITLEGGYKAYRTWALEQFEKDYAINILGGYTGSNKTGILQAMQKAGHAFIDLEAMAHHKGSAFGSFGQPPQPSQEQFENLLALALHQQGSDAFWLEDESQRIGSMCIPPALWQTMRQKPVYFVDIPFEKRLAHILETYSGFDTDKYVDSTTRIQKRLGPQHAKAAIDFFHEGRFEEAFRILLEYYDRTYSRSLLNRDNADQLIMKIPCNADADITQIIQSILLCQKDMVS